MTEADVRKVLREAVHHSASAAGREADTEDLVATYEALKVEAPEIFQALDSFLRAYVAWWAFHERLKATGRAGTLTGGEANTLSKRIDDKDATRTRLLELLRAPAR
jgi:hypothetical protein